MTSTTASAPKTLTNQSSWFFVLATFYISTLCVMNLINITRIVEFGFDIGSHAIVFALPIGILPYPLTFLCMDVVTECFGKEQAHALVKAGIIANIWMLFLIWAMGLVRVPLHTPNDTFDTIRFLTMSAILSSMLAYIVTQYLDVYLFHTLKTITKGKHLWLRNNVSTLISQLVDTVIVIGMMFWLARNQLPSELNEQGNNYLGIMASSYGYKCVMALLDTLPCYVFVIWIKRRLAESSRQ